MQAAALCLLSSLVALVLKKGNQEMALLLTILTAAVVLLALAGELREILAFFQRLGEWCGVGEALLRPLYKTAGIALLVKLGKALCQDAGEPSMAAVVETAGTVCAFFTALPLFEKILEMFSELMP